MADKHREDDVSPSASRSQADPVYLGQHCFKMQYATGVERRNEVPSGDQESGLQGKGSSDQIPNAYCPL